MPVEAGKRMSAAQMQSLASLANSRTTLAGRPYSFSGNNWLSELGRLRSNIAAHTFGTWENYVSGPWPVLPWSPTFGNIITGVTFSLLNGVEFYYPDALETGLSRTITCFQQYGMSTDRSGGVYRIKIGGNVPVRFQGAFAFRTVNATNPFLPPDAASCTTDFPGASFQLGGPVGKDLFSNEIDTIVSPGIYTFSVSFTNGGIDGAPRMFSWPVASVPSSGDFSRFRISATHGGAQQVPGIHGSLPVFKLSATIPVDEDGLPFGLYTWNNILRVWQTAGAVFGSEINGHWCGRTPMIGTLPDNMTAWMPWNPIYDGPPEIRGFPKNETIREKRNQPAEGVLVSRTNSTSVAAGNYIFANGAYHYTRVLGTTGSITPNFQTVAGQVTPDGNISWICMGNNLPARARSFSIPSYPFYKYGETNQRLMPHHYENWTHFIGVAQQPYWWIRKVRISTLRDITADQRTINELSEDQMPQSDVQLGCLRNGVFASFGTFKTGQTYSVMWPIFQQHALLYLGDDPEERFNVSAELCPFIGIPQSHLIGYPILADHYNDTEKLLQKMV